MLSCSRNLKLPKYFEPRSGFPRFSQFPLSFFPVSSFFPFFVTLLSNIPMPTRSSEKFKRKSVVVDLFEAVVTETTAYLSCLANLSPRFLNFKVDVLRLFQFLFKMYIKYPISIPYFLLRIS